MLANVNAMVEKGSQRWKMEGETSSHHNDQHTILARSGWRYGWTPQYQTIMYLLYNLSKAR